MTPDDFLTTDGSESSNVTGGLSVGDRLTIQDVERLMRNPDSESRRSVVTKLAREIDQEQMSDSERALTKELVALFAHDVEVSVRSALADNLRNSRNVPRDVALLLAQDVESVSLPFIQSSSLLTQEDLIALIHQGNTAKQTAIARRQDVLEKVADALVTVGSEEAVTTLMHNTSARIDESSFTKAVVRFQDSENVKNAMAQRPVLPLAVAERLVTLVSDQLRDTLMARHPVSANVTADLLLQTRERAIMSFSQGRHVEDIKDLVKQMHKNGRLTPSLIMRALCCGEMSFVEISLAVLTGLPMFNVQVLIHDPGQHGFEKLWQGARLPDRYLPTARVALSVIDSLKLSGEKHDLERYRATIIERVLTQMQTLPDDDVEYLIEKLGDMLEVGH